MRETLSDETNHILHDEQHRQINLRHFFMSDPLIRACEDYVVLEPGKPEKFLTLEETKSWLISWLNHAETLPQDLQNQPSIAAAANRLIDTACDLEIKPGFTLQWFAVRLDPPAWKE